MKKVQHFFTREEVNNSGKTKVCKICKRELSLSNYAICGRYKDGGLRLRAGCTRCRDRGNIPELSPEVCKQINLLVKQFFGNDNFKLSVSVKR